MLPTPAYLEKGLSGAKQIDIFSQLLSDRIIMLFDKIDDDIAGIVIAQLLCLEAADSEKEIRLYINSPGGSVDAGLAIYDTIRHLKCDVSTLCIGSASSMGAFLLAAGTKGKRYSLENSTIMIHQALGAIPYGQATDIKIQAERIEFTKNKLNTLLSKLTGKTKEQIANDTERDNYMTAFQAKEYGIIDEVIVDE
ncbi:MAG: ATP-dependent Clp protease proteolytic subunit [Clostridia bacterium]|nr:ATP-dependent Clp protease proteolytic subunit [Clostridia bacterium]